MKKLSANTSCSGCGDRRVKLKDDQYVCVSCEVPREEKDVINKPSEENGLTWGFVFLVVSLFILVISFFIWGFTRSTEISNNTPDRVEGINNSNRLIKQSNAIIQSCVNQEMELMNTTLQKSYGCTIYGDNNNINEAEDTKVIGNNNVITSGKNNQAVGKNNFI